MKNRVFSEVGIENSDARELPRIKNTNFICMIRYLHAIV